MLSLSNVQASYGGIAALKGVSLTVGEGEIVTVLGANGAGKSTMLKVISGLVRADAGDVAFEGRRINSSKPFQIARMGVVHCPEGRRLFANLTVLENLEIGAYARENGPEVRADVERMFDLFPALADRRRQRSGTLSGGEQQMLAVARALMAGPRLLLLDEPSLGLAPILIEEIFRTIRRVRDDGVTVLLVEQNAHMALEAADRGYVLETGLVTLSGPADELRRDKRVVEAYLGGA
jgi:branched-chain amino acid transport system ATP-binding protein